MVGLILENGNLALLGASRKNFPELIPKVIYTWGDVTFTNLKVIVIAATLLVFVLLQIVVRRTKWGLAMRAISYDRVAVPLMGIPAETIIVVTFALGSPLAALAGVLFALSYPVLEPYMGALIGWKASSPPWWAASGISGGPFWAGSSSASWKSSRQPSFPPPTGT